MLIERAAVDLGNVAELFRDRHGFQRAFAGMLRQEPALAGEVLDIGCGPDVPEPLAFIPSVCTALDGVDPDPAVTSHPRLRRRWNAPLESADVPANAYDLAYAYNVVEHVSDGRRFLSAVRRALKPGGVFWALTPHARHPFTWAVGTVQAAGLKRRAAALNNGINDYPSYYRINSIKAVTRAAQGLGFASARFHFMPCTQWDTYFPNRLRFLPHVYDRLLGLRVSGAALLIAYRLEADGATAPTPGVT